MTAYAIKRTVAGAYAPVLEATKAALATEGFGVLTEIDVQATLRKKLNVDFGKYVILGACNPPSAYAALTTEHDIGLMLPCNVIVSEHEGRVQVAAIAPTAAMSMIKNPPLRQIAREVEGKLRRVIEKIEVKE